MKKPIFYRFNQLNSKLLNVEYQVHTNQTDGEASIAQILAAASSKQLAALAFTEHVRKDTEWFPDFADQVRQESAHYPNMDVFVGCEAKVLNVKGSLDVTESILSNCDIVLGSVHSFPAQLLNGVSLDSLSPAHFAEIELELSLGLLDYAPIDVLAHPGGMYARKFGTYPEKLYKKLLQTSLKRGIAIEVNSSYLKAIKPFLILCAEINPWVSIGSDAHKLEQIGLCRDALMRYLSTESGE